MEGPSLVIACEEFDQFKGQKVLAATGTSKLPFPLLKGSKFKEARSWGKHFLLVFDRLTIRIHFLMFGSYRIDSERADRVPKLTLKLPEHTIRFYSCAIRVLEEKLDDLYDWSTDIMSDEWDPRAALAKCRAKPQAMVCDLLMDQDIFTGVGNIIKNEVLYRLELHPESQCGALTPGEQRALITDAREYSLLFYEWKKHDILKRNWQIFRKRDCPEKHGELVKQKTGEGERVSHYCPICQKLKILKTQMKKPAGPTVDRSLR